MRTRFGCLAVVVLGLGVGRVLGDSPLPPPERGEVWSADRQILVISDPVAESTTVYRVGVDRKQTKLWAMVGWYRQVFVSDDGDHLVIGYDGGNLIPAEYRKEMVMLRFVERGNMTAAVTLEALITDFSKFARTVSHYNWGWVEGFNGGGRLVVKTVEGERVFDVGGKRVEK